ncbi:MAG: HesA/MoeB/ThiF family protein [Bacteroidales bacterium]
MKQLTEQENNQYAKLIALPQYGKKAQERLKNAKVLVVGAGGLGSAVLPSLVAAGIGEVGLVEFDVVSLSNLPRQLLYSKNELGKSKLKIAMQKLSFQNPEVTLQGFEERFNGTNANRLLENYDVAIDCSDNFETRYLLNDTCQKLQKPLIFGSVHDVFGQVALFHGKKKSSLRHLFPEPPKTEAAPGILPQLPLFIGSLMVNEVIHFISETSKTLDGKLLTINLQTYEMNTINLTKEN